MSSPVEGHLQVTRTARYWSVGGASGRPAEIWFVLHGYRQLARRFLRRFQPVASDALRVVAPEGLSRFYTDDNPGQPRASASVGAAWMTREDREHEIGDYVAYLDRLWEHVTGEVEGAPTLVVVGFSQGVATACRWLTLGGAQARRLILWGAFVPPDLDVGRAAERLKETEVVLVRGDRDPVVSDRAARVEEEDLLAKASLPVRLVDYAGGHDIDQRTLRGLAGAP